MASHSSGPPSQGEARAYMTGHAGSVRDPYFTMRLYHSRFVQPTGTPAEPSGAGAIPITMRWLTKWGAQHTMIRS